MVGLSPWPFWAVLISVVDVDLDCGKPAMSNLSDIELEEPIFVSRLDKFDSLPC